MADGIFINGKRPASKKAIKDAISAGQEVIVEVTGIIGADSFAGNITQLPKGKSITFVGPNPYVARNFYGTIEWKKDKLIVK